VIERHLSKRHPRDARRRRSWRCLAVVCVTVGLAGVCTAGPAFAWSQRGHVFVFSFGGPGADEGSLQTPSAVALNQANGDVYVADRAGDRVDEYEPVLNGAGVLTGERFVRSMSVPAPEAVAVDSSTEGPDPSRGDVYVVGATAHELEPEEGDSRIYKFTAGGEPVAVLSRFSEPAGEGEAEPLEALEGVAVDAAGGLYVYEQGAIDVFDDAVHNRGVYSLPAPSNATRGFALGGEGDFYVAHVSENPMAEELESEPAVVGELEGLTGSVLNGELEEQPTTAVAVNPSDAPENLVDEQDDVYLANVNDIGGAAAGSVAELSPSGGLVQRFSAPGLSEPSGVAVDDHSGEVFVSDIAADRVDVFALEPAGKPSVEGVSACATVPAGSGAACAKALAAWTLDAHVNPDGAPTSAYFEYGRGACSQGGCARSSPTGLGESFSAQPLSLELAGLAPGVYHYRVHASSALGSAQSPERTITVVAPVAGVPDGRAWELVSPPETDGAEAEAITKEGGAIQAAADGGAISYVADGPMPASSNVEGSRNPEQTQVLSVREPGGWVSQDIATANSTGAGIHPGRTQEYQLFSSDLALALLEPFPGDAGSGTLAQPPLSPPLEYEREGSRVSEAAQQKTFYERADTPIAPEPEEAETYAQAQRNGQVEHNAGFLAVVSEANALAGLGTGQFGGGETEGLQLLSANADLSGVVFASHKAAPGLYEWSPGSQIHPVSVNEQGRQVYGTLGHLPNVRDAISDDGSRVFWTSEKHLYVTDPQTRQALQLDKVVSGAGGGPVDAVFQTASTEGTRVFFTDTQRLTADSKAQLRRPDLYVYELAPGAGLSGTLTDLTPEGIAGESADVLEEGNGGGVLGASEDGSYIYFVANGALAEGAPRGDCVTSEEAVGGRTCDLYLRHYSAGGWEPARLVAVLANEDAPDWGGSGKAGNLARMTSRVSPDGRYLAFMSRQSLTGYDNEDKTGKAPGERVDEEVYLYDAQSESLVCASCDPSGERPEGVFDPGKQGEGGSEQNGLLVDRPGIWNAGVDNDDHWLAGSIPGWTGISVERALYQSRYLSDSGRLFFDSPDSLLGPGGGPRKESVYEYEPAGVGSCQSEGGCVALISSQPDEHEASFLDASENGNDVFFLTTARLSPQDNDSSFVVYDAHICEPSSPCTRPLVHEAQSCLETPSSPCKTPGAPGQEAGPYATEALPAPERSAGAETLANKTQQKPKPKPLTRAQKLAQALNACKHRYKGADKRGRRRQCEANARRRYAPKLRKRAGPERNSR
jgi:DNA-binding beta-propeller fold protein YncE